MLAQIQFALPPKLRKPHAKQVPLSLDTHSPSEHRTEADSLVIFLSIFQKYDDTPILAVQWRKFQIDGHVAND